MNNEQKFDKLIGDKLAEVPISQPVNAWDKFSRASKMNVAREGHFFDQAVNRSLAGMSAPLTGQEWSSFKNQWDTHTASLENKFDEQVREAIDQNQQIPTHRSQEILESALTHSVIRNNKLLPSKIIEACMIAVILLLLFMYTPLFTNEKEHTPTQLKEVKETEQQFDRAQIKSDLKIGNDNDQLEDLNNKNQHQKPSITYMSFNKNVTGKSKNSEITSGSADLMSNYESNISTGIKSINSQLTQSEQLNILNSEQTIPGFIEQKLSNSTLGEHHSNISNASVHNNDEIAQLEFLTIQPRSVFAAENFPIHPNLTAFQPKIKKGVPSVWIGFRLGQAFDHIKTPSYIAGVRSVSIENTRSTAMSVNIEVKKEFFNIETGVKYSFKQFADDRSAHFINIPLTLKKDFLTESKLSPFFKIGPDITLVAAADYNEFNEGERPPNKITERSNGLINKGHFSDNSFVGLHGAIGLEYKITPYSKFTIDLAQQINPFEKGISTSNYRFSETSISIGYKRLLFENLY